MGSRSVNSVTLIGHLGKDAETKFTPGGVSVTTFSVATSRRWKDQQSGEWKEETDWSNVTAWRIENLAEFLVKGKQVYVQGRLQTRSYEKDGKKVYKTDIVSEEIILLGGGSDSSSGNNSGGRSNVKSQPRQRQATGRQPPDSSFDDTGGGWLDDEIAF